MPRLVYDRDQYLRETGVAEPLHNWKYEVVEDHSFLRMVHSVTQDKRYKVLYARDSDRYVLAWMQTPRSFTSCGSWRRGANPYTDQSIRNQMSLQGKIDENTKRELGRSGYERLKAMEEQALAAQDFGETMYRRTGDETYKGWASGDSAPHVPLNEDDRARLREGADRILRKIQVMT